MATIPLALQYMFAPGETPWAPLPDPGAKPTVAPAAGPLLLDQNLYVVPSSTEVLGSFTLYYNYDYGDFENRGRLWTQDGVFGRIFGNENWGTVKNYGSMVSLSSGFAASAVIMNSLSTGVFQNFGDVFVVAKQGTAGVVEAYSIGLRFESFGFGPGSALGLTPFVNAGNISVWSGSENTISGAFGFALMQGGHVVNSGTLRVSGQGPATPIAEYGAFGIGTFGFGAAIENSGTIVVTTSGPNTSVGILVKYFHPNFDVVIVNTGEINADTAIYAETLSDGVNAKVNVTNSGLLSGDLFFKYSTDSLVNTGRIVGDISFGVGNDFFDNRTGSLTGTLSVGDGDDTILAGVGYQALSGENGNDALYGGADNDALNGQAGADRLFGETGHDLLVGGDGNDYLEGGKGGDTLIGGAGLDFASFAAAKSGLLFDLSNFSLNTGDAADDIYFSIEGALGSSYSDVLIGDNAANELQGGAGDDNLHGGAGDDTLEGGNGADSLDGGDGQDYVSFRTAASGVAFNLALSAAYNDTLISIEGVIGSIFSDTLRGDVNSNTILAGSGDDIIYGFSGRDCIDGGAGNDTLDGGKGADRLIGGLGVDIVSYLSSASAVVVDFLNPANNAGSATGDAYDVSIEGVVGSHFADVLVGNALKNDLRGGIGDDTLNGNERGDFLSGDEGNDLLIGGAGEDAIYGGDGNDAIDSGKGNDTVDAGNGDDKVYNGAGSDYISGGAGDDALRSAGASASLSGDSGNDVLTIVAGAGQLDGGDGADTLTGNASFDALHGGAGTDWLFSGGGADTLNGGDGADFIDAGPGGDIVFYEKTGDRDDIRGFTAGANAGDLIWLLGFGTAFDTFAEVLAAATDDGLHTTINFGGGDVIVLRGVLVSQLAADDFIFG